jgi:hypothetical protein
MTGMLDEETFPAGEAHGFADETQTTQKLPTSKRRQMQRVVFDCETNGLYEDVTKVHCLVLRDWTLTKFSRVQTQRQAIPPLRKVCVLSKAERVYGHNIIDYDIPVLRKLYPSWTPPANRQSTRSSWRG